MHEYEWNEDTTVAKVQKIKWPQHIQAKLLRLWQLKGTNGMTIVQMYQSVLGDLNEWRVSQGEEPCELPSSYTKTSHAGGIHQQMRMRIRKRFDKKDQETIAALLEAGCLTEKK